MFVSASFIILILALFRTLHLQVDLVTLINQLLLALDVLEHVFGLGDAHVVWKDFGIVLIKLEDSWQPVLRLLERVEALQVF